MDQNRVDRAARLFLGAAAGAAAAGAAVGWYAAKVEPHRLTVTRPELCRRPPVKTLFFSDVHFGPMYSPEFLEPLVDAINAEAPEMVLFGGDFFAKFGRDAHMLNFPGWPPSCSASKPLWASMRCGATTTCARALPPFTGC